jgi:hypothetical protein
MAFPNLRSDNNLIAFNRRLQELGWDLPVSGNEPGCRTVALGCPAISLFLVPLHIVFVTHCVPCDVALYPLTM